MSRPAPAGSQHPKGGGRPRRLALRSFARGLGGDLDRAHKVISYVLVGLAVGSLWLGQAFPWPVGVLVVLLGALSWFWEPPRVDPGRFARLQTALNLAVIGLAVYGLFATELGVIPVGTYYVLYLTCAKLFQRRGPADSVQILALSFVLMAAATAFEEGLTYGAFFVPWVLLGVLSFALYHLRAELRERPPVGLTPTLLGRGYVAVLLGLSSLILLASLAFFFFFPRLGFGFFARKSRKGAMQSGFSESVELGRHGTVADDDTVVMRIRFPDGRPPNLEGLYWRGISFDHYDGRRWRKHLSRKRKPRRTRRWDYALRSVGAGAERQTVRQEIYLDPIGSQVIFALHPVLRVDLGERAQGVPAWLRSQQLSLDEGGDLLLARADALGTRYSALSLRRDPPVQRLRQLDRQAALDTLGPRQAAAYLQVPPMDPRVAELARRVTAAATNDYDRARLLAEHLATSYAYTTDLPDPGAEQPLTAFLFTHRRGHCEYFATAMVLMLRTLGVPARSVNGFRGGAWNEFDDYLAVRNSEAHSWVEVAFADYGWVPFEPTPAGGARAGSAGLGRWLAGAIDSLRFTWYRWVIEYDLNRQIAALQSAGQALGVRPSASSAQGILISGFQLRRSLRRNLLPGLLVVLLSLGVGLALRLRAPAPPDRWDLLAGAGLMGVSVGVVLGLWRPSAGPVALSASVLVPTLALAGALVPRRTRRARRVALGALSRAYLALRDLLGRHGLEVSEGEGPECLAVRVRGSRLATRAQAVSLIERYAALRFGGAGLKPADLRAFRSDLRSLRRALAKGPRLDP